MFSEILEAVSASRPRADVAYCIQSLAKRLAKTHSWTVCPLITLVIFMFEFCMFLYIVYRCYLFSNQSHYLINSQVALKTLIVIHRALREVDHSFCEELINHSRGRALMFNLSHFRDESSPVGTLYSLSSSNVKVCNMLYLK